MEDDLRGSAWLGGAFARPWDPQQIYYVIVGCGVTAAVNYTTLRATYPERLGDLPVLILGGEEPWSRYAPLPMGQWPSVLAPPSFRDSLQGSRQHDFLWSSHFAQGISRQWQYMFQRAPFHAQNVRVQGIAPAAHGFDIDIGAAASVRAAAVDVCGGPGPARRLCDHLVAPGLLPYPAPAAGRAWRLVETGESFLDLRTAIAAGHRVIVVGGGPTAAWCVERALAADCHVLWVIHERVNPAFVSSRRNDALADARPLRRHRRFRSTVVSQLVFPASHRLRLAEGYAIDALYGHAVGVEIRFRPAAKARQRHVDHAHVNLAPLANEVAEQAVIAIGQETGHAHVCKACGRGIETNSWATMLRPFLDPAFLRRQHYIIDPTDNMPVALQSMNSRLRVLGAAFLAHPYTQDTLKRQRSSLFRYLSSLCEQANVDRGAAMAGFTTAKANGWFTVNGNRNRNSATYDQLLGIFNLRRSHARRWYTLRQYRIDPLTNAELSALRHITRER